MKLELQAEPTHKKQPQLSSLSLVVTRHLANICLKLKNTSSPPHLFCASKDDAIISIFSRRARWTHREHSRAIHRQKTLKIMKKNEKIEMISPWNSLSISLTCEIIILVSYYFFSFFTLVDFSPIFRGKKLFTQSYTLGQLCRCGH
jgi:hypothetical protein